MRRRTTAVLFGIGAVVAGVLLLQWLHGTAAGYAPADPGWSTGTSYDAGQSGIPMIVLYSAVAVAGVCLASIGWWRPFIAVVVLVYLVPLLGGEVVPLLADAPDRVPSAGMAMLEAALLAAPSWLVADRMHATPRPLPIPSRLALPGRDQKALPRPKHV